MTLSRRRLLPLAAGAAALPLLPAAASAQAYPSRPVRLFVGFPPGGTGDIVARIFAHWLTQRLGQQIVVENRPGAATNLAIEAALKAPADGYTLVQVTVSTAVNATLYAKLNFNVARDIAMVGGTSRSPLVLEVNPAVPVTTIPEFIAYAKQNPGKVSMGSFGVGTISHVAGALFKTMAGVDMIHVPYRGTGPMLTDLLGGQIQAAIDVLPASIGHIRAGKLRALAVTTAARSDLLPSVPTVAEFLPGYEANGWTAIGASRKVPADIVERLNRQIAAGFADEAVKARLGELGATALSGSPAELDKLMADEIDKWGKVIRTAGIKPE